MARFIKFICTECGHVFDEDEVFVVDETLDVIDGVPYKETYACCPECNGSYEQAKQCEHCGEWFRFDDLIGGVYCENCMEEFLNDTEKTRAFAVEGLDSFAEFVYSEEQNADV